MAEQLGTTFQKKKVRFSAVTIRDYDMTLGDNPFCSSGAPVSIDWTYQRENKIPLEAYEQHHPPRRHDSALIMPHKVRQELLVETGNTSFAQILRASRQNEKDKEERLKSIKRFRREEFFANYLRLFRCWNNLSTGTSNQSSKTKRAEQPVINSQLLRRIKVTSLNASLAKTGKSEETSQSKSAPSSLDVSQHSYNLSSMTPKEVRRTSDSTTDTTVSTPIDDAPATTNPTNPNSNTPQVTQEQPIIPSVLYAADCPSNINEEFNMREQDNTTGVSDHPITIRI